MIDVVLIDGGGANLGSVRYALERLGARVRTSVEPAVINSAARVILPGVGAAAAGMARLHALGLVDVIRGLRQPLLGICLGMQLLFEFLAEGGVAGLRLLPGRVEALPPGAGVRVPHMGWNAIWPTRSSPLLQGLGAGEAVYFVHGFAAAAGPACIARCVHGRPFAAAVQRDNVFGVQFHPERSAAAGARLLANFLQVPSP